MITQLNRCVNSFNSRNIRLVLILVLYVLIVQTAKADVIELSITGSWSAGDFKVTETSSPSYDPDNPQFDGKVFGVAPSTGNMTIRLRVNTDGSRFFAKGSTFTANGRGTYTLAHDFYGYRDVTLVGGFYTFGNAIWENIGILSGLEGPDNTKAALWTDFDITKGDPARLSFRMFGTRNGVHPDLFVGSRTHEQIGYDFLVWEYYKGEEIRSRKYSVKSTGVSGSFEIR